MSLRLNAALERLRTSLFFVPMAFVVAGAALGVAMVQLDSRLGEDVSDSPFISPSTVESARELLGVVAAATITVAGVAFSISLLVIQQASSQYSPRVVHSLFRDPFNRRVMGFALGTFTYALMVLRAVRSPLEEAGDPVIPNASVGLAVVLGVLAILAVVAFIDHNAHALEVSQILHRVTLETAAQIDHVWPSAETPEAAPAPALVEGAPHPVAAPASGWVQQLSTPALLDLVPDGGTVWLETCAGRYLIEGTVFCRIWPQPEDLEEIERITSGAVQVGPSRTMREDPTYGICQLADVALVALSPGVNDPSTARDAIFHLADVLSRVLPRDLPPEVEMDDRGRRMVRVERPSHESITKLAFDEIRRASTSYPAVSTCLLEVLHLLERSLAGHDASRTDPLRRQADLVLAGAQHADLLPADLGEVRQCYEEHFGATGSASDAGPIHGTDGGT